MTQKTCNQEITAISAEADPIELITSMVPQIFGFALSWIGALIDSMASFVFGLFTRVAYIGYTIVWLFYDAGEQLTRTVQFFSALPAMTWNAVTLVSHLISSSLSNFYMDFLYRFSDAFDVIIVGLQSFQDISIELLKQLVRSIGWLRELIALYPLLDCVSRGAVYTIVLCIFLSGAVMFTDMGAEAYLCVGGFIVLALSKIDWDDVVMFQTFVLRPALSHIVYIMELLKMRWISEISAVVLLYWKRHQLVVPVLSYAHEQIAPAIEYVYVQCDVFLTNTQASLQTLARHLHELARVADHPNPYMPRHILVRAVWNFIYVHTLHLLVILLLLVAAIIRRIRIGPVIQQFLDEL